ncbi:hypothetical protein KFL_000760230 [Klebsormidium nitens]|uniref:Uncharacterized protein n=1 Tax=Klebsormidium nitens TaxID=105231 RepID=A0A1Y1HRN1_KLENI|nr:hypothetical protein KFL_000760230 [Klebsormidium nitens]|eukprot:GAQ81294.1 hypothetical protein KFL_000760230 [Klebsormidium nitens]
MYRSYETAGANGASSTTEEDDDLYSGYNNANEDEVVYGNYADFSGEGPNGAFEELVVGTYDDRGSRGSSQGMVPPGKAARTSTASTRGGGSLRPLASSSGRPPGTAMLRVPMTASRPMTGSDPNARPMTSMKGAGFSSQPRPNSTGRFDPLNQAAKGPAPALQKKSEASPEEQCREMERKVNRLLEESAELSLAGDHDGALEKAKEAGKRERLLCKQREQANLADQINGDLTFAVCFNLAHQYHQNKLYSEALDAYTQVVKNKQFPQAGRLRVNMGNIYCEQRKYPQAIKMYRMALDQLPATQKETRYKIMRNIGVAFMRLGQYQDALQSFEAIMDGSPDYQSGFNLVLCYFALGDREKMKRAFSRLLAIKKYEVDSDEELDAAAEAALPSDGLKEELLARQKRAHRALLTSAQLIAPVIGDTLAEGFQWATDAVRASGRGVLAQELDMARAVQHLQRRDFGAAIGVLKDFERKEPALRARAALTLSALYFWEGDLAAADKYAEMAVKVERYNARALVNKGNCLYVKGDVSGATALYQEALGVEADCVEAMYNLGLAQKRSGQSPESLATFKKLHAMLPDSPEVMYQIASLYEVTGPPKQAIKWLEMLHTRVLHDPGVLARLGAVHSKHDDEAKALHYFSEAHRVYPVDMDVISWLGAFHVKNEVYEKAMPFFDLAAKIQPSEVKWQLMVASCYRRIGAYPQALATYKEIHRAHPENIECLRYLVHICTDLGHKEEIQDYAVQLRKAERAAAQAQEAAAKAQVYAAAEEPAASVPVSMVGKAARPSSGAAAVRQERVGEEAAAVFAPAAVLPPRPGTAGRKVKMGVKEKSVEDEWGSEELGDDLLPM